MNIEQIEAQINELQEEISKLKEQPKPRTGRIKISDDLSGVDTYWFAGSGDVVSLPTDLLKEYEIESGLVFYDRISAQDYFDRRALQVREMDTAEASWHDGVIKQSEEKKETYWAYDAGGLFVIGRPNYVHSDKGFYTSIAAHEFIDSLTEEEQRLLGTGSRV